MRYLRQVAWCAASAFVVVLVFLVTGYRGAANGLAMLLPPVVIALMMNPATGRRALMAMALIGLHVVLISLLGVLLIGY